MAQTRRSNRGAGGILNGIEPPPHIVSEFNYKWRNWLYNLSKIISLNINSVWYNITSVIASDTPYQITNGDQVVLADPDTGALVIDLPDGAQEGGISFYIKNIDESGTYGLTINPGTNKIEQPAGIPTTSDVTLAILDSYQLMFDSENSTWWII